MKRRMKLIVLFCLVSIYSFSQVRWDSLPGKFQWSNAVNVMYADSNYMYVAGRYNEIGGKHMQGIARWDGTKWDSMGAGIDGLYYDSLPSQYPNNTFAITSYQNKLYVGGVFSFLGKIKAPGLGTWNGTVWDSLVVQPFKNSGVFGSSGAVSVLTVINNKLYMGGEFDTVARQPDIGIATWDGAKWSSLGFPDFSFWQGINSICEYKGSLYVGGHFSDVNDTVNNILRLDSMGWHLVDTGIKGLADWINSMVVYNGELYVAGHFYQSDGNAGNCIQKWNGTSWSDVGGGTDNEIFNLMVYNNKLYTMGQLTEAGGISASKIAEWDGTKWCSLGSTFDNTIGTACIYKDSLYIGGGFWTIDGDSISYIAEWTGGDYTANCSPAGVSEVKGESEEVKVYPNPTAQNVTVQVNIANQQDVEFRVYNLLGEPVYSTIVNEPAGTITEPISVSSFPNGNYILEVHANGTVYHSKITKLQ